MKLRFRENSLRLRVNRREVEGLASGDPLVESVVFPDEMRLEYSLRPLFEPHPSATFNGSAIVVRVPATLMSQWARGPEIGLYFDVPAGGKALRVAIEKDLECLHETREEPDPDAFERGPDE